MEKRTFSFYNDKNVLMNMSVREPTNKEVEGADTEYSKAFVNALKNGIPTRELLSDILQSSGVWTEEDNAKIRAMESDLELEIEKHPDNIKAIEELNADLTKARRKRNSLFQHTAESRASDAQRDYIVSQVIEDADTGKKIWKNFDEFRAERDGRILHRVVYEYLVFAYNMPSLLDEHNMEKIQKKEDESNSNEMVLLEGEKSGE